MKLQMKLLQKHGETAPFLIGVCGRSCSGKGAVTEAIASANYRVIRINADMFFAATTPCRYKGYDCWEDTKCIRWKHMEEVLTLLKSGNGAIIQDRAPWTGSYDVDVTAEELRKRNIILLEGFLLFTRKEVLKLLDMKIWIDVSDENMLYRRLMREGNMAGINYIHKVIIPVSRVYEEEQRRRAERVFDGNPEEPRKREELAAQVTDYINSLLKKKGYNCRLGLPPEQIPWNVHFGDLITDHAWHPIDFTDLKDWVKQRPYEMQNGQELIGHTFRYRKNLDDSNCELRLNNRHHMFRYLPEPT